MNFGEALELIKQGQAVARSGWNGKGMAIALVTPSVQSIGDMVGTEQWLPFIAMRTVQGKWVPWLASQTDLLSDDWAVAE